MDIQIKKAAPFELSESAITKISLLKESEGDKLFRVYVRVADVLVSNMDLNSMNLIKMKMHFVMILMMKGLRL